MRPTTSFWKWLLLSFALLGVVASVVYSHYLSGLLEEDERKHVATWVEAQRTILQSSDSASITLATHLSIQNTRIPIIETTEKDSITGNYVNLDSIKVLADASYLKKQLLAFKKYQPNPIILVIKEQPYTANYYYYGKSSLLDEIRWYPIIQLFIAFLFIAITIASLRYIYKNEQNVLWVSLAKETAHQLGTPVSNLQGWVELLKENPENASIAAELRKDVTRLQLVTDRFGKIGNIPQLETDFPAHRIEEVVEYMKRRMGGQVTLQCDVSKLANISTQLSAPLFDWVIENILKNALDALEGKGSIQILGFQTTQNVVIEITDSGKGMDGSVQEKIFDAGFTTKKRGWGIGLALTKRIIEQYHKGKISVRWSEPGKGSCFRIELPILPAN
jgi:signal transduction histidine kinase